jgi:hypothetical protein
MKGLFIPGLALLSAVSLLGAQDRAREILSASYDPAVIQIEAVTAPSGIVRVHASDRSQYLVNFTITSSPADVRAWADEADKVLEGMVAVRSGEEVRTKTTQLPTADEQILELTRETTPKTARFALFFGDGKNVNEIDQSVTKEQARKFVAAMRRAAEVADGMTAENKRAESKRIPSTEQRSQPDALISPSNAAQTPNRPATYFEFQVEKPADLLPSSKMPVYPPSLKSSNIEGQVLAQFVVDENGLVDMDTFKVLKATNALFIESLRNALPGFTYSPAMIGGRRVKQLVQQAFQFRP